MAGTGRTGTQPSDRKDARGPLTMKTAVSTICLKKKLIRKVKLFLATQEIMLNFSPGTACIAGFISPKKAAMHAVLGEKFNIISCGQEKFDFSNHFFFETNGT